MKKISNKILIIILGCIFGAIAIVYILNFTSNSKYIFAILLGSRTNFHFEQNGYRDMDNCKFKEIIATNKDYFIKLSNDLAGQNVKLLVNKEIEDNNVCVEGTMYGILVQGLDNPFENRLFLIKHWITLKGIQYITETDEYTENEFKETIEVKDILNEK